MSYHCISDPHCLWKKLKHCKKTWSKSSIFLECNFVNCKNDENSREEMLVCNILKILNILWIWQKFARSWNWYFAKIYYLKGI